MFNSTLSFPIKPDRRGTLATVSDGNEIITQAILDLVETRMGERKMLPSYGLPDFLFDALDDTFAFRLALYVEEQIRNYIFAIESVKVEAGTIIDGSFRSGELSQPHQAAIKILWSKRGQAIPQELIYPTWRLVNANAG